MKNMLISAGLLVGLIVATACAPQKTETDKAQDKNLKSTPVKAMERLDTREILPLNPEQRMHVLEEMRGLLAATQGIIDGVANEDRDKIVNAASAAGMKARHTVESQENMKRLKMRQSVPPEFMKLGRSVHNDMDAIAAMAKEGAAFKDIQHKLAQTMTVCVACHAAYQIPNP